MMFFFLLKFDVNNVDFSQALYYKKYSSASDVWSFGVVLFEIWSVGHKPFEGIKNNKVTSPARMLNIILSLIN